MKPTKLLSIILALILMTAPILVATAEYTPGPSPPASPIILSVSTSPTIYNDTTDILSGIGLFTVYVHLYNATGANLQALSELPGSDVVGGIEVHLYFTNLLTNSCYPTAFTDCVGNPSVPSGVLYGATGATYALNAGYYNSSDEVQGDAKGLTNGYYMGADEYVVAVAFSNNLWNGTDGLVAELTFNCTQQPGIGFSPNDIVAAFDWLPGTSETGITDGNTNPLPYDILDMEVIVPAALPPPYVIPSTYPYIYFADTTGNPVTAYSPTGPIGNTFNVTVGIGNNQGTITGVNPAWDVAGFDIKVEWNTTLLTLVGASDGGFLQQAGAATIGLTGGPFVAGIATSYVGDQGFVEGVFTKTTDPTPSQGIDTLFDIEFSINMVPNVPLFDTLSFVKNTTIGYYLPDLVSWAHPERTGAGEPWNGSITAVDLGPQTFAPYSGLGTPSCPPPVNGGYFFVGAAAAYDNPYIVPYTIGPNVDLYDQFPAPWGGQGYNMCSDAFSPQALVNLYAQVNYSNAGIYNKLVSFEVFNNNGQKVTILQSTTMQNGTAVNEFRLPQPQNGENNDTFGWWHVTATVDIDQNVSTDNLWFYVGWLITPTSITESPNPTTSISPTGQMTFTMTVSDISGETFLMRSQEIDICQSAIMGYPVPFAPGLPLFSIDVYDIEGYPIGELAWSCDLAPATYIQNLTGGQPTMIPSVTTFDGTQVSGTGSWMTYYNDTTSIPYTTPIHLQPMTVPTWARPGLATAYGLVLTEWPALGGVPYGPEDSTTFQINAY